MDDTAHQVKVARVDWASVVPGVYLFRSFRMATQPTKLAIALVWVIVVYLAGMTLAGVWGPAIEKVDIQRLGLRATIVEDLRGTNLFGSFLEIEVNALSSLLWSAATLDAGLNGDGTGVWPALHTLVVGGPGLLWLASPAFCLVFMLGVAIATLLAGGAICRLSAAQAINGQSAGLGAALGFIARKGVWLLLAPIIPAGALLLFTVLLALGGLLTFNWPVLDIVGGLLFGLMLVIGALMAVVLIGLVLGLPIMPAALAVEGTDGYDAVSRSMSYLSARPWQYALYGLVTLIYGAITFLFVGLIVALTLALTLWAVDWGVFREWDKAEGLSRLHTALWGTQDPSTHEPGGTLVLTGWLLTTWLKLLAAIPFAYAVSYFFTASTWVYLLLRRSTDGSALDASEDATLTNLIKRPEHIIAPVAEKVEGDAQSV